MFVSGRHDGRRIIFDVTIIGTTSPPPLQPSSDEDAVAAVALEPLRALVDTGASSTSIAPETARNLRLLSMQARDIRTASGWHRARVYEFWIGLMPDAAAAPFVLPAPIFGVELAFDGSPFDILLGMDVLSQGDLIIRPDRTFTFEF